MRNRLREYTAKWRAKKASRLSALLCLLLLLLALTGCQLAREEAGEGVSAEGTEAIVGDRLAGVLITTEYLDLFDFEAYIDDNIENLNGSVISDEDSRKYSGRIYATLETRTATSESGDTITTKEYVFPTIEGIEYFAYQITSTTESTYTTSTVGEGLSDSKMHLHSTDAGDFITLEATLYVAAQRGSVCYYFNPVYQDAEGNVYVTSGQGMESSVDTEGINFSQSVKETHTVTQDGEMKEYTNSVTVSVQVVSPPETIVVLQMDGENHVIAQEEYIPGQMPETIAPEAACEYILVESHKKTLDGENIITREIFGKDAKSIQTMYEGEGGICIQDYTEIQWYSE